MKSNNMNGYFSLVEIMIVIAILGILSSIALPAILGESKSNTGFDSPVIAPTTPSRSSGLGGTVDERCISGYKFVIGKGAPVQILNDEGKGINC